MVKNTPAVQETWVRSQGWEDAWEEGMATHCSVLAWRIPWTKEPGGLRSMGSQRDVTEVTEHTCTQANNRNDVVALILFITSLSFLKI